MRRRYDRQGLLALDPKAFFELFFDEPDRTNEVEGDVAVVSICGPLEHHAGWWCDSYDEILERVDAACTSQGTAIVLKIDSPGGLVSGCFEAARAIREKCAAAGKRLVAYVDGQACSAAYALACAASEIVVPETGFVGSVGIIDTRLDCTEFDKQVGTKFAVITSGARKADGHPHLPITTAELAESQARVDSLAGVFFDLVEELRGRPAAEVAALQARVYHGESAVAVGLADSVRSFPELLEAIRSPIEQEPTMTTKASKYSEGRALLEEAAKGDDEEEAEKAKRALAAMDGEPDDEKKDDDEGSKSEGDEPPDDEKKDDDAKASRSGRVSASTAGALASTVSLQGRRLAALEREREAEARATFLATRPDLDESLVKVLETKPLAEVKAIVNAIKKPAVPKPAAAAAPGVAPTRGASQVDRPGPAATSPHARRMDEAMGFVEPVLGVKREGTALVFGVMSAAEAAEYAASKENAR